ncbi:hypothetical protein C4K26_6045 [Pseudomonas chlororaphis]|nr:hypothetical protein C4K26_6045 [Pseudomonas chlororaphis]
MRYLNKHRLLATSQDLPGQCAISCQIRNRVSYIKHFIFN